MYTGPRINIFRNETAQSHQFSRLYLTLGTKLNSTTSFACSVTPPLHLLPNLSCSPSASIPSRKEIRCSLKTSTKNPTSSTCANFFPAHALAPSLKVSIVPFVLDGIRVESWTRGGFNEAGRVGSWVFGATERKRSGEKSCGWGQCLGLEWTPGDDR